MALAAPTVGLGPLSISREGLNTSKDPSGLDLKAAPFRKSGLLVYLLAKSALQRIKDFEGLNLDGFDNFGNYSFGIKEHIIFPEINFDKVDRIRGMDITLVSSGKDKKATLSLLEAMNFPFNRKNIKKKVN